MLLIRQCVECNDVVRIKSINHSFTEESYSVQILHCSAKYFYGTHFHEQFDTVTDGGYVIYSLTSIEATYRYIRIHIGYETPVVPSEGCSRESRTQRCRENGESATTNV